VLITDISCSTYQFAINRRSLPGNYRPYLVCSAIWSIFTARCYDKRGTCRRRVSVRPFVCLCVYVSVTLRYCVKTECYTIGSGLSFQMGCFVDAEFLLTIASRGPSATAEPLVCKSIAKGLENQKLVYLPPHLNSVSALPASCLMHKIDCFMNDG